MWSLGTADTAGVSVRPVRASAALKVRGGEEREHLGHSPPARSDVFQCRLLCCLEAIRCLGAVDLEGQSALAPVSALQPTFSKSGVIGANTVRHCRSGGGFVSTKPIAIRDLELALRGMGRRAAWAELGLVSLETQRRSRAHLASSLGPEPLSLGWFAAGVGWRLRALAAEFDVSPPGALCRAALVGC